MWERVKQNIEKKEKLYVFKVQLFLLATEAETTTARNKEPELPDNVGKREEGLVFLVVGLL